MSGWRSTLNLTGALSYLLGSSVESGPNSDPELLETGTPRGSATPTAVNAFQSAARQRALSTTQLDGRTNPECLICTGEFGEVEFSNQSPTSACSHPPQVCIGCLRQVISTAITSGEFITGIMCPSLDCSQRLDYYDVQKWATNEVFERYDKLLLQDSLRTDEHYVLCLNPSCNAGQDHLGGESNNIVTCHACTAKQCFRHQVLWHEGFSCEQWDEHQSAMNQQQEMSDEWIQTETKPCPRCRRRIQKIDGCDHFECKRPGGCGHQFCWECLAPWEQIISGDNSRHYDHCRYYSGLPGGNTAPPEILAASTAQGSLPQVTDPLQLPIPQDFVRRRLDRNINLLVMRTPPPGNAAEDAHRALARRNRMARVIGELNPIFPPDYQGGPPRNTQRRPRSMAELDAIRRQRILPHDFPRPQGPRQRESHAGLGDDNYLRRMGARYQFVDDAPRQHPRGMPLPQGRYQGERAARRSETGEVLYSSRDRHRHPPAEGRREDRLEERRRFAQSYLLQALDAGTPAVPRAVPPRSHRQAMAGPGPRTLVQHNGVPAARHPGSRPLHPNTRDGDEPRNTMDPARRAELREWLANTLPPSSRIPPQMQINGPANEVRMRSFIATTSARGNSHRPSSRDPSRQ